MILSSCHDYSLNNDCHCDCHFCCHCCCHGHYMQRIYVYFIISCLALSCLELTSITTAIIGMTLYDLVLHYIIICHIISYLMLFNFISSADLISISFYSTLFQIDLILLYFLLLNSIYYIVQYSISYQ